jgi:hypothetical protein
MAILLEKKPFLKRSVLHLHMQRQIIRIFNIVLMDASSSLGHMFLKRATFSNLHQGFHTNTISSVLGS